MTHGRLYTSTGRHHSAHFLLCDCPSAAAGSRLEQTDSRRIVRVAGVGCSGYKDIDGYTVLESVSAPMCTIGDSELTALLESLPFAFSCNKGCRTIPHVFAALPASSKLQTKPTPPIECPEYYSTGAGIFPPFPYTMRALSNKLFVHSLVSKLQALDVL